MSQLGRKYEKKSGKNLGIFGCTEFIFWLEAYVSKKDVKKIGK